MLKLTSGPNGKYTPEELTTIGPEDVKKMILLQDPKAFDKKTKAAPKKKAPAKKAAAKKAAPKKK
jgi:DNA topoisomerase-1